MELGKIVKWNIIRLKEFGAYVAAPDDAAGKEEVLLPGKQVPEGAKVGDSVEVFLYKDSADRPIATTKRPLLTVGEVGRLTVRDVTKIGAFLDIGLERDVLLPFRERVGEIKPGQSVLAALYVDHSGRLAATMRIYPYLKTMEGAEEGKTVHGTVYEIGTPGIFVAVDDRYYGLIPKEEAYETFSVGQEVTARITYVRPDGKLNLSTRDEAFRQMDSDADMILRKLSEAGGTLPYGDGTDPETVRRVFHISKNAFKRALGRLFKERKITLGDNEIRIAEPGPGGRAAH